MVTEYDNVDRGGHGGAIALVGSEHDIPLRRQVVERTDMKHSTTQGETGIRRASFSSMLENSDSIIRPSGTPRGYRSAVLAQGYGGLVATRTSSRHPRAPI
jgi:hypothetical protein